MKKWEQPACVKCVSSRIYVHICIAVEVNNEICTAMNYTGSKYNLKFVEAN